MKSYNHLWEQFISEENIRYSILKGAVGKMHRGEVKRLLGDLDGFAEYIDMYARHFRNYEHDPMIIKEGPNGKEREIIVPAFDEHCVHHMIVSVLMPMFTTGMYKHTYSSIPGRGLHRASKRIRSWIDNDPKNVKYCLKLDIRKFFNSIDQELLLYKLSQHIHDVKFMRVVKEVVTAIDQGLPLGFYTSHWFANWLLQPLDHFIKEELHIPHYVRYMDDMVLFSSNKKKLHKAKDAIEEFLREELDLELKNNWQVFRFDYIKGGEHYGTPLDFIGFKFYRDRTTLRKSLMLRMTRKARKINKKGKFTIHDAHQMMSYLGWVDWSDTYKVYTKYVAPYVTFDKCRKRISQYDKKQKAIQKVVNKYLKEVN